MSKKCEGCTWLWHPDCHRRHPSDPACRHFRPSKDDLRRLKALDQALPNTSVEGWLGGLSYSQAFVVCIGAGPWKEGRRKKIQQMALDKLDSRDLSQVGQIDWYPLTWQNKMSSTLALHLANAEKSMEEFCWDLIVESKAGSLWQRQRLYDACGSSHGAKVLSLFCRDCLKIPSFPIDRHVKRQLEAFELPINETAMVILCNVAGLDPRRVAIKAVQAAFDGKSINPDWSSYNAQVSGSR